MVGSLLGKVYPAETRLPKVSTRASKSRGQAPTDSRRLSSDVCLLDSGFWILDSLPPTTHIESASYAVSTG